MANDDQNIEKDIENLRGFLKEIEDILKDVKKSDVLSKTANKYEQNLTKLISTTKGIINNTATQAQAQSFEKLLHTTDMSLKVLRKNNKDDEEFQGEFKKVFGNIRENQEASDSIMRRLSSTLVDLTKSVAIINATSRKDVKDTALSFFTGPFGRIIDESVDLSGIKESFSSRFGGEKLDGQAHDGMTNIPKEGTYNLDGGERIVKRNQNQDLTDFLKSSASPKPSFDETILSDIEKNTRKTDAIKVYNEDHDSSYFDSIIDNDDRIEMERSNTETSRFSHLMEKFEILSDIINKSNISFLTNLFIQFDLWTKRFMRHPVLNSLALLVKPMSFVFMKVWRAMFGQKKTETERIVQSNDNIVKAIRKQEIGPESGTKFTRFFRNLNQFGEVLKAQEIEKKRSGGETLTAKEQAILNRQEQFITRLPDAIRSGTEEKGAASRFGKKDMSQETPNILMGIAEILQKSLFISDEMLETIKEKGKGAGRGILGIFGKLGRFAGPLIKSLGIGLLGLLGTMGAKLGPLMMKAAPMFLTRLLPVGTALFAGFKLGEWLNVKFGEWLNLEMDLGSFIGMKVFDFVESVTSVFDDIGRSIEQNGLFDTVASIASGGGIPKTESKEDEDARKLREQREEKRSADEGRMKGAAISNVVAREKAGQISEKEKVKLIQEITQGKDYAIVPVDVSKINQQSVAQKVVVPQTTGQQGGVVNNNNVVNNSVNQVKERLRPHVESAATALGIL